MNLFPKLQHPEKLDLEHILHENFNIGLNASLLKQKGDQKNQCCQEKVRDFGLCCLNFFLSSSILI